MPFRIGILGAEGEKYLIEKKLGKNPEVLNLNWKYQLEFMK